ncbi:MAG: hypothetical protein KDK06_12200 [Gammaproteobacteria bacterium]|nr:hypothetical protein [Gammaproteobacteria bacterium]
MSIGKELATWACKSTSITKGVDDAGRHTFALNCEGTVKGAWTGASLMTLHVVSADLATGTYTATAAVYLEDGSAVTATGSGVLGACGPHEWRLNGFGLVADGTRFAFEGVMALASRSLDGKLHAVD